MNHPFVDANKRVAFAAISTCLAISGLLIVAEPDTAHRFIFDRLETGTFRHDRLAARLRDHTQPA